MTDNSSRRAETPEMVRVAGYEGYELTYFADKHGITMDQARGLIGRIGNSRYELDAAAKKLKGSGGS